MKQLIILMVTMCSAVVFAGTTVKCTTNLTSEYDSSEKSTNYTFTDDIKVDEKNLGQFQGNNLTLMYNSGDYTKIDENGKILHGNDGPSLKVCAVMGNNSVCGTNILTVRTTQYDKVEVNCSFIHLQMQ